MSHGIDVARLAPAETALGTNALPEDLQSWIGSDTMIINLSIK